MLEILQTVPLFQHLSEEQLTHIRHITSQRKIAANSVLFRENEPGDTFYILTDGAIKIYTSDKSGSEKILTVLKAGDSFGELSLLDGKPRSASAETMESSTLLIIKAEHFLELLKSNFELNLVIMQELCNRIRETNQHVHDLTFLDARTRIIKNLIVMANKYGVREGHLITINMHLNYEELSRMAGVTKNELIQVIRDFQDRGILQLSADEFILNLAKLRS